MTEQTGTPAPGYPAHWEADAVLRDGGTVALRPIRPDDAAALQAFHVGQSARSRYLRFFADMERLGPADLTRFTEVDHHDRVALVAVTDGGTAQDDLEQIIAVARFDRTGPSEAVVAFNVADAHHGRGLGSVLLEHLAAAALEVGVSRFTAEVLPENETMLAVFRDAGYVVDQVLDDGIVWVSFDLDPTEQSRAVMADREHRAEARSMTGLLTPRSVLVIGEAPGAAEHPLAAAVLANLRAAAPDHLHVEVVGWEPPGTLHHADPATVAGPVDLIVLAVAAHRAAAIVRSCARLRPRAVVALTGGFAEAGPAGAEHQRDLVRAVRAAGARLLGPGSYGFSRQGDENHPTVDATVAPVRPAPGRVGLFCQSAAVAVGLLDSATRRGLGVSTFISAGNRADVSGNDAMQAWTADDATDVVAAYLESIGNPRKFSRVTRRLAAAKPVVVLTAGHSGHVAPAGQELRATGVPRQALDQVMARAGAIRVTSQHELLDVAQLLAHQPLPEGPRVAVLGDSEPVVALVAEAATSSGLEVADRQVLRGTAVGDVAGRLDAADVDAVVVVMLPVLGPPHADLVAAVARAAARGDRTTVACIRGLRGVTPELTANGPDGRSRTVPAYSAPEDGVRALAAAVAHRRWLTADRGTPVTVADADRPRARRLVESRLGPTAQAPGVVRLTPQDVRELLGCYGLRVCAGDEGGVLCRIRSVEDPRFGPVVSFSLAGDAELLEDVAHAIPPLTDVDVAETVRSVRAAPRLLGSAGTPAVDLAAVEDVLGRVAVMADDMPTLHRLELLVAARPDGAQVRSAEVEIARAGRADGMRRMLLG